MDQPIFWCCFATRSCATTKCWRLFWASWRLCCSARNTTFGWPRALFAPTPKVAPQRSWSLSFKIQTATISILTINFRFTIKTTKLLQYDINGDRSLFFLLEGFLSPFIAKKPHHRYTCVWRKESDIRPSRCWPANRFPCTRSRRHLRHQPSFDCLYFSKKMIFLTNQGLIRVLNYSHFFVLFWC